MSLSGNKGRDQRLYRATEIFGLVRKAFPLESWPDERCGKLAAKLWCLGHVSVEALKTYLFSNSFDPAPEKTLLEAIALEQRAQVRLYDLPTTFEPYLSHECPCRQVDFLHFINYVRRVYDFEDAQPKAIACTTARAGASVGCDDSAARNGGIATTTHGRSNGRAEGKGGGADVEDEVPPLKIGKDDVRYNDRYTYARRALRKAADDLNWNGKEDFFKAVGLVLP
jgi:hypothetical protein